MYPSPSVTLPVARGSVAKSGEILLLHLTEYIAMFSARIVASPAAVIAIIRLLSMEERNEDALKTVFHASSEKMPFLSKNER